MDKKKQETVERLKDRLLFPYRTDTKQFKEALQEAIKAIEENEELRKGICEHVKTNELRAGCKLCDLAISEKGYPMWVKKAKNLQQQLDRVNGIMEYDILKTILAHKYPDGLPLLPNATRGATLLDVYPEEYKEAQTIHNLIHKVDK